MKIENAATVEFLSRSTNEGFARSVVVCFAAQMDPTLEEVEDVKTAVSEAVTNAIVHGYPNTLGKITLRLRQYEGRLLEIQIKDKGVGIGNIEEAKTPLFTTGGSDRSGMGFTIMESFVDDLRVRSAPGKGTTVTLRKRLASRMGGGR
jgi:stage II sporulation protein AB (anti-sigma F factor)